MSYLGLQYALAQTSTKDALRIYYDFNTGNIGATRVGGSDPFTGFVENLAFSGNSALRGLMLDATGSASGAVSTLGRSFVQGEDLNLSQSNIQITGVSDPISGFSLNKCSAVCVFENSGNYVDGILFGSLNKRIDTVDGEDYESYEGFNFGITKRGHLFLQTNTIDGASINVAHSIELSPRNIVSFSVGNNQASIARYDILNQEIQSETFPLNTQTIFTPSGFYLGGAPEYLRSTQSKDKTFSGVIGEFAMFSRNLSNSELFQIGSGLVGDYFLNSGSVSFSTGVTGVSITPLYGTGITGYQSSVTGYRLVPTGLVFNDVVTQSGVSTQQEGYRYFAAKSGYVEEVGFLAPANFGTYQPLSNSAAHTLGLQTTTGSITGYYLDTETQTLFFSQPLYLETPLTGFTSSITGYTSTQLTGVTAIVTGSAVSGVTISESAEKYKKNFINFLGSNDI